MDAYLASRELKESQHFYLNINFEILNGCKFSCRGCHVEKNAQNPIGDHDEAKLSHLLKDLKSSLYLPFIAFIGPTDFLVADNFTLVFTNPKIIQILKNFKRISLQTTFIENKNAKSVAKILNELYADIELEVNIVIDPAKIMDDQYLKLIEKNKIEFLSLLQRDDVKSFGIMNVYNYDETKIAHLLRDYDFMHTKVGHLFETTIDYNFSLGRNKDLTNEEFLSSAHRIKNLFNDSIVSDEKAQYLRFSFGKLTDSLIERQYNYRNGKLYYSPLLYERFVSFRDEFEVPLCDFTAKELEQFEMTTQLEQYNYAPQNKECYDCPFVASCIDRGILFLMNAFGTKECLVARDALFIVNSMGALPIHDYV